MLRPHRAEVRLEQPASPPSSSSWLIAKLARSKKRSPMPAYSQSTIRMRSPSSMKFAFRRSLWQGRSGAGPRRSSIRRPSWRAQAYAGGTDAPRANAIER